MKLVVAFELDVDEQAWAREYGHEVQGVGEDVRAYVTTMLHDFYPSEAGLVRDVNEVKTYTREQISTALNAGADLAIDGLGLGEPYRDAINLAVNSQGHVLDNPDTDDIDEVISENYDASPEEVRGWWDW
ncbi:hypothetical protein ACFYWP_01560 [Actinacidiphila glaucinigra]|uniref:hypothetical protein n=1 Tax=Actinacidiphila glaucinigra TaxID=235986 RepID=UPI0036995C62